jgi:protein SCO1/2
MPAIGSTSMTPPDQLPPSLREIGIDQRLNQQVSLNLEFVDESGRKARLGDYFGRKPVLLALVYYECPMLCNLILNGVLRSLRTLSLDAGRDFEVVAVSIDPREGPQLASARRATYLEKYNRAGATWHFLTGSEPSIRRLAQEVGYRYTWDEQTKQFAHASGIMVLTPEGRLSRYLYGVEYSAKDLRLGLVEASAHKIGSPVDRLLLYCFHYDPATGKYGMVIMNVLRAAGAATALALVAAMVLLRRRERTP